MEMYRFEAMQQHQKNLRDEAQRIRLGRLVLQSRRGTPGVYRSLRLRAGRGLIAAGRFLVSQSDEAAPASTWEMQREV